MNERLASRKLWVALAAMVAEVVIALGGSAELASELSYAIAGIASAYCVSQAVVDRSATKKK